MSGYVGCRGNGIRCGICFETRLRMGRACCYVEIGRRREVGVGNREGSRVDSIGVIPIFFFR